jgi:hypothetical protein
VLLAPLVDPGLEPCERPEFPVEEPPITVVLPPDDEVTLQALAATAMASSDAQLAALPALAVPSQLVTFGPVS